MLSILAGLLLLGICVFFHELGHFLIGKWVGVRPRVFSIGYGRALFFRRRKKTIYQITAIPLGGYVQFYGDDPTKQGRQMRKGDFFSVGPWRRIALAFGGPLFSILLGFVVVFVLLQFGYRSMDNVVRVDNKSALYKAGLQNGDRIISVDGNKTASFERVLYEVGFAKGDTVHIVVERNGKEINLNLPVERSEVGTPGFLSGARPLARLTIVENVPKGVNLLVGDEILKANGENVFSIEELIHVLNAHEDDTATLEILRKDNKGVTAPLSVTVPLKKVPRVVFKNIIDQQTKKSIPEIIIEEGTNKNFQNIFVNNETFATFSELREALQKPIKALRIGPVEVTADVELSFRRLIGIRPAEKRINSAADLTFMQKLSFSADETVFITKSTLVGLWRIIQGKLSFNKSVSGPVKMVAIAAKTVEMGWQTYFLLLAQITIILGVMNLLPIPVLDGGHILFYLIEALYKPLSFKVQATATRVGMTLMLAMGIYVIGLDIFDVFIKRVFG
ncbi:MAG: putative zinc metalloprotease [Turneriella sp.]|nr:putative zinc metalloprotease [Turneriella sp.]